MPSQGMSPVHQLAAELDRALELAKGAEKETIRPAAVAASQAALTEAIGDFISGTPKILDLSNKLRDAINGVHANPPRQSLKKAKTIFDKLRNGTA